MNSKRGGRGDEAVETDGDDDGNDDGDDDSAAAADDFVDFKDAVDVDAADRPPLPSY